MTLVLTEPPSGALESFLQAHTWCVSSQLLLVEVPRAARRAAPASSTVRDRLARTMALIDLIAIEPSVLKRSVALEPPGMRALDAIHVATALAMTSRLATFVSYDRRQLAAARLAGLPTASPGIAA